MGDDAMLMRTSSTLHGAVVTLIVAATATRADAQLPGLPVFQGAFPAPGLAVGVNLGRGDDRTLIAGALGYGTRSERFALATGVGVFGASAAGYRGSRAAYGARFAVSVLRFADQRLAVTPFAGFGSTQATLGSATLAGPPAAAQDTGAVIRSDEIPLGAAVGWRMRLGTTRALALSVAPAFTLFRRSGGTTEALDATNWVLRTAAVAELAVTSRIGVSVATEFGQEAGAAEPGPRGARFGLGASFAFARR